MPVIPEPSPEQVTEVVIDELKDIPYPKKKITAASLLGTFFSQVQKQDERNGLPVSRAQIFLRDVKKRIGKSEVFLQDLLDTERYSTVGDLVADLHQNLP